MNLSISNIAWRPEENLQVLPILTELGIRGIEAAPNLLLGPDPTPADIRRALDLWEGHGIHIVAFQSLLFGFPDLQLFGDKALRDRLMQRLLQVHDWAAQVKAGVLIFGSPKNRRRGDLSGEEAFRSAVDFFGEFCRKAGKDGPCLCIEPNAVEYGCDFIVRVEEALRLVEAVGHPAFGFHMDAGVMTLNHEPGPDLIRTHASKIRHFHISEPFLKRTIEAKTPHRALAEALRASHYSNWVSIEMVGTPDPDNVKAIRDCLLFAKGIYGA